MPVICDLCDADVSSAAYKRPHVDGTDYIICTPCYVDLQEKRGTTKPLVEWEELRRAVEAGHFTDERIKLEKRHASLIRKKVAKQMEAWVTQNPKPVEAIDWKEVVEAAKAAKITNAAKEKA